MVVSYWRKNDLEQLYISKNLLTEQRNMPGIRLYAISPENDWKCPKNFRYAPYILSFIRNLQLKQATTIGRLSFGGVNYLVTGIKPKELADSFLIGLISDASINREIQAIRIGLWFFTATSLIISLFLGVILSQRFLTPIRELSRGVEAIQKREFDHRLPSGGLDELGELARTFNRVMEGLSDLEVGKIVQESLFPKEEVKSGEYRIFGRTMTASELGGDYFDILPLPDGKILFLIGDVSGHGVPAALVMAMAKALVERECEVDPQPVKVLSMLHEILLKILKRRKMMTCFMGMLDTKENVLHTSNAGHNFPYFFPGSGAAPFPIESHSKPLGSWKVNVFKAFSFSFNLGDCLMMYTDGLVEAKTRDGVIGYERMVADIRPLLSPDPRESCERIFDYYRKVVLGTQEDDITVLILTRQANVQSA